MKKLPLLLLLFTALAYCQEKTYAVYFDFDKDVPDATVENKLKQWIKTNKNAQVTAIYGYADSIGNANYNIDLSQRRGNYVYRLLKDKSLNVTADTEVKAFGEAEAHFANRALDRRVIIHYSLSEPDRFSELIDKAKKGDRLRIPNLNFYDNSDVVLPKSEPVLKELLDILKNNPKLKIDIQGHICCREVEENEISLKRALTVYRYLLANGIEYKRLSYKSFGSSRPLYPLPEKSEEEKEANRRVEIEIIEK